MRGYRLGLLTASDYNNLTQCETLDDIKLYLVRRKEMRCDVGRLAAAAWRVLWRVVWRCRGEREPPAGAPPL